jgi:hypothetical protein
LDQLEPVEFRQLRFASLGARVANVLGLQVELAGEHIQSMSGTYEINRYCLRAEVRDLRFAVVQQHDAVHTGQNDVLGCTQKQTPSP